MLRILTIITLIISAGFINCSRKPVYTCGLESLASRTSIESRVLQLQRIAIADTTILTISGKISGKDSSSSGEITDILIGASVFMIDNTTGKIYDKPTDLNGEFILKLPVSSYDLKVQNIAYNTLIVRDVSFDPGDVVEFNALLGQSGATQDSTIFIMQPDKSFKQISTVQKSKKN